MVSNAFVTGGFAGALAAFAVAGIVIVVLMIGLSLLIGTAQEHVVDMLTAHTADVKHWGGRMLILVGTWFILLAVFATFFARVFPV